MASAHPPNGVVEDEGKSSGLWPRGSSAFHDLNDCTGGVKSCPANGLLYPVIIIGEQGTIGLLTEWQNLYPRREIMVLGMGLKERRVQR